MTAGKLNLVSQNSNVEIDIINIGIDNEYPKFSFFDTVYRRHTNFSMDNKDLEISGTPNFGQTFKIKFQQNGDLVGDIYFEITLPAASSCFSSAPASYANWTNAVGFAIIDTIKLKVGGSIVDEQSGLWYDITNELTDPTKKVWPMVGKVDDVTKLKFNQTRATKYSVPLNFSFNKTPGLAIPIFLTGIEANEFEIEVKLKTLANLLLHDGGTVNSSIGISEFKAHATYYTLETYEKERIKNYRKETRSGQRKTDNRGQLVHLIETVQQFQTTSSNFTLNDLKGSVKELVWVVQHNSKISSNNPIVRDNVPLTTHTGNDHFNYSGITTANNALDPFTSLTVKVGNSFEFDDKSALHYRQYLPYRHHSAVPNNYVYVLPLCLNPEDYQPSGALNLLNTNTDIRFSFTGLHAGYTVKLFAVSYRFLLMNTNDASVQDVTSKTSSDILQDSFSNDSVFDTPPAPKPRAPPRPRTQQRRSVQPVGGSSDAAASSVDVTFFNNQITAQNRQILELQAIIDSNRKVINELTRTVNKLSEGLKIQGAQRTVDFSTLTVPSSIGGGGVPIKMNNRKRF